MKQIPDQMYRDLKRILPLLAMAAEDSKFTRIANAGRLARKYGRKLDKAEK